MRKGIFCAHRGVSALMPENTLPAFAASMVLGADEIEFDVRATADRQLIVSHDAELSRISDGDGNLSDFTLAELRTLNIGGKHGWTVGFCTPEEVFDAFAGRLRFNIHLKEHGEEGWLVRELLSLAQRYHAEDSIYFAVSLSVPPSSSPAMLLAFSIWLKPIAARECNSGLECLTGH